MNNFLGMVYNKDTTWKINQIQDSLAVMSIFLDLYLRDILIYVNYYRYITEEIFGQLSCTNQ